MYPRIQLSITLLLPPASFLVLRSLQSQAWTILPLEVWNSLPTVSSAGALLRISAMALAAWMTVSTVGYVISRAFGLTRAATGFARAAFPYVRRLADRALVTTVIVGTVASTPVAAAPPPIPAPIVVTQPVEVASTRATPVAIETPNAAVYEVVKGDNFWKIAAAMDPRSSITSYWLDMIELNMQNIRSGDPNLIFPGELLQLPEK